jgi:hypothetical protein
MGPNLLPETLFILLRFRLYPTARHLYTCPRSRWQGLNEIFWCRVVGDDGHGYDTTSDITTYRFKRLSFGLTSWTLLLASTLRELADCSEQTLARAASLLDNSTYVDDFASWAENEVEVIALHYSYELTSLMRTIRLPMAKWASNFTQLKTIRTDEGQ